MVKVYTDLSHELEYGDVKLRMSLIQTALPMMLVVIITVRGTQQETVIWKTQAFSEIFLKGSEIFIIFIDFILVC